MQGLDGPHNHYGLDAIVYNSAGTEIGGYPIYRGDGYHTDKQSYTTAMVGEIVIPIPRGGYVKIRRQGTAFYGGFHIAYGIITSSNM